MERRRGRERGQAIVLVALVLTVLFGFLGLAIDGGRGYLDRRNMQASADAAALAAAYNYMNNHDYGAAELAAVNEYANNERIYVAPTCAGYGSAAVSCSFADPSSHALTINVVGHSIAGVTFQVTGVHRIPITVMQVLGGGSTINVGATATAVARPAGTYGAAIQTLSPGNCNGGSQSLVFTGTSITNVTGDVWSNGSISDNGQARGTVNGNVIDICPNQPPNPMPNFTVSGSVANGFNIPDPGYAQPALNTNGRTWSSTSGATEQAGTYASDPRLTGGAGCYFLAGGVYDFAGGFTDNGGFVSNVLRPPDEPQMASAGTPNMTTLSGSFSGTGQTRFAINPIPAAIPSGSPVFVGGQQFTTSANIPAGDDDVNISRQDVVGTIPSGSVVTVGSNTQFWDSNGVGCSSSFSLSTPGNGNLNGGTYSVVVTAVRWQANGVANCSGPSSPSCYQRESAPSVCKTIQVGNSGNLKVAITADPGATDFNVYVTSNGTCGDLTFCTDTGGNASVTITNCAGGPQPSPPDGFGMPLAAGLPNADPAAGTPPHGDLANENHCVDPTTGNNSACPGAWTVGAAQFFIPGGGNNSTCLNMQGGGDMVVYSGYQYQRVLLFEPGPEQAPPANTCTNNVAGHGLTSLIGIFYMPAASVTIIGSSNYLATIAGGVIAWTASVKGNGGVSIMADPTLRTWPSAVHLTQ